MHPLTKIRRANQEARLRFENKSEARPILAVSAFAGITPSDLEGLETIAIEGQAADGSFIYLESYDPAP